MTMTRIGAQIVPAARVLILVGGVAAVVAALVVSIIQGTHTRAALDETRQAFRAMCQYQRAGTEQGNVRARTLKLVGKVELVILDTAATAREQQALLEGTRESDGGEDRPGRGHPVPQGARSATARAGTGRAAPADRVPELTNCRPMVRADCRAWTTASPTCPWRRPRPATLMGTSRPPRMSWPRCRR